MVDWYTMRSDPRYTHRFEPGDIVETDNLAGIFFEIKKKGRTYDGLAGYDVKFWGQSPDTSPAVKGRVNKHYRIKTLFVMDEKMRKPNPLILLAVAAA